MSVPVEELAGIERTLLDFLTARTHRTWDRDADLFAAGGMSSLFALDLVVHLETAFGVTVEGDDLVLDNFRTVPAMAALVQRLRTDG